MPCAGLRCFLSELYEGTPLRPRESRDSGGFGVFWTGEGLGIDWPGQDIALVAFAALFLGVSLVTASALRRPAVEIAR
jgi:hypothetical protein